jgi:chromosome segregation ATPase
MSDDRVKTDLGEFIVMLSERIEQLEHECDAAAERAQQHQIDMQALRAKAGIAANDASDEDALVERQNIRVKTMRDTIQRLAKELATAQMKNESLTEQLAVETQQFAETVKNMKGNFQRTSDELFDRNQEVLALRGMNDKLLNETVILRSEVKLAHDDTERVRRELRRALDKNGKLEVEREQVVKLLGDIHALATKVNYPV